jgi:hypothetical protein
MRSGVSADGDAREVLGIEPGLLETEDRARRNAELVFVVEA